ncbi:MAG TPA: hypothetical protein VFU35_10805 [Jatrophihabitans sp.]|nr:hypothetical protein [Jatrophihabitans sp.]
MSTTVRIGEQARGSLRCRRLRPQDASVEALASDREQSAEVQAEREGEAGVLSDGLD